MQSGTLTGGGGGGGQQQTGCGSQHGPPAIAEGVETKAANAIATAATVVARRRVFILETPGRNPSVDTAKR